MARPKNKTVKEIAQKMEDWIMQRSTNEFTAEDMDLCCDIVRQLRKAKEIK